MKWVLHIGRVVYLYWIASVDLEQTDTEKDRFDVNKIGKRGEKEAKFYLMATNTSSCSVLKFVYTVTKDIDIYE